VRGDDDNTGYHKDLLNVEGRIGGMQVGGSIIGSDPEMPVEIVAGNRIGQIHVRGSVENTTISTGAQSGVGISQIVVDGQWKASSVSTDRYSSDGYFGNADDILRTGSRIGLVKVGSFAGTPSAGDSFGVFATRIASVIVNGTRLPLSPNALDNLLVPETDDVKIVEHTI
jgi:hypothetical protein